MLCPLETWRLELNGGFHTTTTFTHVGGFFVPKLNQREVDVAHRLPLLVGEPMCQNIGVRPPEEENMLALLSGETVYWELEVRL